MKQLTYTIENDLVTLDISDLKRLGILHSLNLFNQRSSGGKDKLCNTVLKVALYDTLTVDDVTMIIFAVCAVIDVLEAAEIQDDKELKTAYMFLNSFGDIKKELTN